MRVNPNDRAWHRRARTIEPGTVERNVTALRGVEVEVIVPGKNNQALVQWASTAQLEQLLERGVRVFASSPPFDHSKLMVVDACWVLLGSANWDPRSLQLNFEFNVEAYEPRLASAMEELFAERRDAAREITLTDVRSRSVPVKLRDGVARLLSPYLCRRSAHRASDSGCGARLSRSG